MQCAGQDGYLGDPSGTNTTGTTGIIGNTGTVGRGQNKLHRDLDQELPLDVQEALEVGAWRQGHVCLLSCGASCVKRGLLSCHVGGYEMHKPCYRMCVRARLCVCVRARLCVCTMHGMHTCMAFMPMGGVLSGPGPWWPCWGWALLEHQVVLPLAGAQAHG